MKPFLRKDSYSRDEVLSIVDGLGWEYKKGVEDHQGWKTAIFVFDENDMLVSAVPRHNLTVLGGALTMLETFFQLPPNAAQHLTLNTRLGIPDIKQVLTDPNLMFQRSLGYYCIGNGAENPSQAYDFYDPAKYNTGLYGLVPFQSYPQGGTPNFDASQYRLKRIENIGGTPYVNYYAKKINSVSAVKVTQNDLDYTPVLGDTIPNNPALLNVKFRIFTTLSVSVEANEFKSWWQAKNSGSLSGARISELGLISAYDDLINTELSGADLFTHVTFEPRPMGSESSRFSLQYVIYG